MLELQSRCLIFSHSRTQRERGTEGQTKRRIEGREKKELLERILSKALQPVHGSNVNAIYVAASFPNTADLFVQIEETFRTVRTDGTDIGLDSIRGNLREVESSREEDCWTSGGGRGERERKTDRARKDITF